MRALVLCRHGERLDYVQPGWTRRAARPWDPPLTPQGTQQARSAAAAIQGHLARLGLPPVAHIYTSPLLRCAQTACALAEDLAVPGVGVEPNLAETICENWYYSWAIPGANSRWGGPGGSTAPKQPFRQEQVHPAALWHFGNLYLSSPQLRSLSEEDSPLYQPPPAADLSRIDLGYCPSQPSVLAHDYRWGRYETEEQTAARVGSTANRRCMQHLGQTVVAVTHGGPSSAALEYLTGATAPIEVCGYTGLHVLTIEDSTDADGAGGAWTAHVQGDVAHIGTGNAGLSTAGRAAKL